mmetsp:Transcript_36116/g.34169  ORF Transcript_36116/g.34169 Transcript_36116/m.34169 type:complete len:279 (+) Transcript_36116:139-975(+)
MLKAFFVLYIYIISISSFKVNNSPYRVNVAKHCQPSVELPTILLSNKACKTTIGCFDIIAEESDISEKDLEAIQSTEINAIKLIDVGAGWGNGAHPTTKLCMNFIIENVRKEDLVLDYGTGSGILSIAAAKLGAKHCMSVDIDEDTLIAARKNSIINGVEGILDVVHTRIVYVGEERFPVSDITIANILPGPLSMLSATLWSFTKPGGLMCLSGMRPHELPAIRKIYTPFVDLSTEEIHSESHDIYGDWVSWSVRTKVVSQEEKSRITNLLTEAAMDR